MQIWPSLKATYPEPEITFGFNQFYDFRNLIDH